VTAPGPIQGVAGHYRDCHQVVGGTTDGELLILDASLGTTETTGCRIPTGIAGMGSFDDFATAEQCDTLSIDLDEDNSGLTLQNTYMGEEINCGQISSNVSDVDIEIRATETIESAELNLIGFPPDAPDEHLFLDNANNIDIAGNETAQLLLTNAGGATIEDFEEAIRNTVLRNLSTLPTPGMREVTVVLTSDVGRVSNRARAVFEVNTTEIDIELPLDNAVVCEGEGYVLNLTAPGLDIEWSTGETSNSIQISQEGTYTVTATDPNTLCKDIDSFFLETVPFTSIKLTEDDSICFGDFARITVETAYQGPFNVFLGNDYSTSVFPFTDVEDGDVLEVFATDGGFHFINEAVIVGGPSCFALDSASVFIDVFPIYITEVSDTICRGDSLFLDGEWRQEEGVYEDSYSSRFGCDSNVQTTLVVLPVPESEISFGSCNPQDTGTFIDIYTAANGCDSIVRRNVFYQESNFTFLSDQSCDPTDVGRDTVFLLNQFGCDSLVITITEFVEAVRTNLIDFSCDPTDVGVDTAFLISSQLCDSLVITETQLLASDLTRLFNTTCDPDLAGTDTTYFQNSDGCDSTVIEETRLSLSDRLDLLEFSCDPTEIGVDTQFLQNRAGCDSLVITDTRLLDSDIVELVDRTCTPGQEGIDSARYTNANGCDSLVITTIFLVEAITTDLFNSSCNPQDTGVIEQIFTSSQGCDSIVTTYTYLDPSDFREIAGTTCDPTQARDETIILQNQFGCDSTIDYTIEYVPLDTTFFEEIVCDPANVEVVHEILISSLGCDSVIQTSYVLGIDECMLLGEASVDTIDCNNSTGTISIQMLEGELPFTYEWTEINSGVQGAGSSMGPTLLFDIADLDAGSYEIVVQDASDASAVFNLEIVEILPIQINSIITSDYNSFDVSCTGASDGTALVEIVSGGMAPFEIEWSNGDRDTQIMGLGAGKYSVTVTDARGCRTGDSIRLDQPSELLLDWMVEDQDCRSGFGSISDISADGGVSAYTYSLEGVDLPSNSASNLDPGTYILGVVDANGCTFEEEVEVLAAVPPIVNFGPDITVNLGDSVTLNVSVDANPSQIDSFLWSDGIVTFSPERRFLFLANASISVQFIRRDGCSGSDQINITVLFDDDIYAPNAFSPNFDGINDKWRVFEGGQIRVIEELRIYNRWGDLVFERSNVLPEDPTSHWDGFQNGKLLQPGVFVYHLTARMNDGSERFLKGDILLSR
jgi:gliding motility-associated-like protein